MNSSWTILVLFLGSFVYSALGSEPTLTGNNVCIKQEMEQEEKMIPTREPTQIATTTWCFSIPPRCTTFKTVYKVVYKPHLETTTNMVKKCCDGYFQHTNNTCVPYCLNACINGQCVAPNRCDCNPGFNGDTCTLKCPSNKWGPQCTKDCTCRNGSQCDYETGKCDCTDGWQGKTCDDPCPTGMFGHQCMQVCRCENGGACNAVTGACTCARGFCGPLCEKTCPESKSMLACDRCQNGGFCEGKANNCTCPAGWTGEVCANACEDGFWGKDCAKECKVCHNNGTCDAMTGSCRCPAGYWGAQCEKECDPGRFGPNCQKECDCDNGRTCDPVSGVCNCFNGYHGDRCTLRACPEGKYGKYCNDSCKCSNMSSCHPVDGACMCKKNAHKLGGEDCSMCCILMGGDAQCYKECETFVRWLCAPELNGCLCLGDYSGPECRVIGGIDDAANMALHSQVGVAQANNTGLIVGLVIAVLVLALILVMALFYRRRVKKLQTELASVAYSTSSGTDTDSEGTRAENFMYMGTAGSSSTTGSKNTMVHLKNGEPVVKVDDTPVKKAPGNMYVSVPKLTHNENSDNIYQSIDYEVPTGRHQYDSIGGDYVNGGVAIGQTNRAFENQLYNHTQESLYAGHAPPSYEAVITETMSSTQPPKKI